MKENIQSEKILRISDTSEGRILYFLQYSFRRKTMMIQINDLAKVRVVVPFYARPQEIERFLLAKAQWIIAKVKEISSVNPSLGDEHRPRQTVQKEFKTGAEFLFLGRTFPLEVQENPPGDSSLRELSAAVSLSFDGVRWKALVPVAASSLERQTQIKARFLIWYQMQAKEILGSRVFHYARIMGVEPKNITIKSPKRLWGSCNYRQQTIHLNWHIVMSPLEVLDYVIVHELCHLRVPNHSKSFWRNVEKYLPDYKQRRVWLKNNQRQMILPS